MRVIWRDKEKKAISEVSRQKLEELFNSILNIYSKGREDSLDLIRSGRSEKALVDAKKE